MKTPCRQLAILLGLLVPATLTAQEGPAPDIPRLTFRSSLDVVTIQASVRDARGRPMRGLTARDFEIRDNGQLRLPLSLRADLKSPVSLAVLIDMSGSMRIGPKAAMARHAFDAILSQLRPGEDEVGLFTFDAALHERRAFTRDLTRLGGALSFFEPFGTTSLYDAIAETARRLAGRAGTHKAVVVLTDGTDNSSRLTASEVSSLAGSIDVPVYLVATLPPIDQRLLREAPYGQPRAADLRDLADWTGGQVLFATTFLETAVAAGSIVDEVRQQYVLAIEAMAIREWRRLDVRVKRSSAVVKARTGYFGG